MKAHILDCEDPLKEGTDIRAICGELVRDVVFKYMFDSVAAPEFVTGMTTLNTCSDCYRIPLSKRYVYGMIARSELKPSQREDDVVAA